MRRIAVRLSNSGMTISKSTVHRYLKGNLGLKSHKRPKNPRLLEKTKENRLKFARIIFVVRKLRLSKQIRLPLVNMNVDSTVMSEVAILIVGQQFEKRDFILEKRNSSLLRIHELIERMTVFNIPHLLGRTGWLQSTNSPNQSHHWGPYTGEESLLYGLLCIPLYASQGQLQYHPALQELIPSVRSGYVCKDRD